jgi:hypothetical protein
MSTTNRTFSGVLCLLFFGFYVFGSSAIAQLITPVSQNRYVSVRTSTQSSTDFGPFIGSVSIHGTGCSGSASQLSQINASSIVASGGVSGNYEADIGDVYIGSVTSQFSVAFAIAVHCSYSLIDNLDNNLSAAAFESLAGPTGTIFQASAQGDYSINGVLTPGQYVISTTVWIYIPSLSWIAHCSYNSDLELTAVPEPSTWPMVALGIGVLLGGLRVRRRSSVSAATEFPRPGRSPPQRKGA